MSRFVITVIIGTLLLLGPTACNKAPEQAVVEKQKTSETKTLRERAEHVGAVGDATLTRDLKKNLTGIIDKNAEHTAELEKAAGD